MTNLLSEDEVLTKGGVFTQARRSGMYEYSQHRCRKKSRRNPAKALDSQQKKQSSGGSQTSTVLGSFI